jgi:uncharacterized integral membrane protein
MPFEIFLPLTLVIFLAGVLVGAVLAALIGNAGMKAGHREYIKRHAGRIP